MSVASTFSLGISLSMDAFAASIGAGAKGDGGRLPRALAIAGFFAGFETAFVVGGWALGWVLGSVMAQVDHWVAFILLVAIGGKMIRDAYWQCPPGAGALATPAPTRMVLLALGTSVDAAAVGMTLIVLGIPIVQAALIVGAITFALTAVGYLLGGAAGTRFPRHAEAVGGVLLIGIGANILLSHTLLS